MAKKSFIETSDMVYDYVCTPCDDNSFNPEGLFYCQKCCKQFCTPCKDLHGRLNKNHPVLTQTERSSWGVVKQESTLQVCEQHHGRDVEMYCEDHDVIRTVCVSISHRSCKSVKHLPNVAAGALKSKQYKNLHADVNNTTYRLSDKVKSRKLNLTSLQKTCKKIVDSINELEKKLIQRLAKLKKEVLDEMNKVMSEKTGNINEEITCCDKISENLNEMIKEIKAKGKGDEVLCYTRLKKCQRTMDEADQTLSTLDAGDYEIKFQLDTEMEKFLSKSSFGQFETDKRVRKDHVYTVKNVASYNTNTKDNGNCVTYGCCFLPSGQVATTDYRNERVKLFQQALQCDQPL